VILVHKYIIQLDTFFTHLHLDAPLV